MITLILIGLLVGFALGMTGAGGSIVAVPLLIFGLDLRPQDAMGISLGAVSAAAMVGVLLRRRNNIGPIWSAAMGLAVTGMATAPVGRWLANQVSELLVLLLFSALAIFLALRMWRSASVEVQLQGQPGPGAGAMPDSSRGRATFLLAGAGMGLMAGFFGVGGGFLIVPFLTLYAGMAMDRAISTSLLVISLIGSSGYFYHVVSTVSPDQSDLGVIVLASILGILAGTSLCARLSGARLQKIFSAFVIVMMTCLLVKAFV